MEPEINVLSAGRDKKSEESEEEFNCQPVKKRARTLDYSSEQSLLQVAPVVITNLGTLLNTRSTRVATHHLALQGLSTSYIDQDTSGTYNGELERATPPRTLTSKAIRERDPNIEPRSPKIRKVGYSFPVTLGFKTEKSLSYLNSLCLEHSPSSNEEASDDESQDSGPTSPQTRPRRRIGMKKPEALPEPLSETPSEPHLQSQGCTVASNSEKSRATSPSATIRQFCSEVLDTFPRKCDSESKIKDDSKTTNLVPKPIGTTKGIQHTVMCTSFNRPIKFFYSPDSAVKHPCSWCSSPVFGLWGQETILSGKDISGGRGEDGVEQTRMCCQCSLRRTNIMYCEDDHNTTRIGGLNPADLSAICESLVALASRDQDSAQFQTDKWCSICTVPAEHECQSCGLYLCTLCNDLLLILKRKRKKSYKNIMDDLVELWKEDKRRVQKKMGELRADVEFLLTTGELWVRMEQMGMSTMEEDDMSSGHTAAPSASPQTEFKTRCSSGTALPSPPGTDDDRVKGTPVLGSEPFNPTTQARVQRVLNQFPESSIKMELVSSSSLHSSNSSPQGLSSSSTTSKKSSPNYLPKLPPVAVNKKPQPQPSIIKRKSKAAPPSKKSVSFTSGISKNISKSAPTIINKKPQASTSIQKPKSSPPPSKLSPSFISGLEEIMATINNKPQSSTSIYRSNAALPRSKPFSSSASDISKNQSTIRPKSPTNFFSQWKKSTTTANNNSKSNMTCPPKSKSQSKAPRLPARNTKIPFTAKVIDLISDSDSDSDTDSWSDESESESESEDDVAVGKPKEKTVEVIDLVSDDDKVVGKAKKKVIEVIDLISDDDE